MSHARQILASSKLQLWLRPPFDLLLIVSSTGGHPTAFRASGGAGGLEERPAGLCCDSHMAGRAEERLTRGLMRRDAEITASSAGKHAISRLAPVCSA